MKYCALFCLLLVQLNAHAAANNPAVDAFRKDEHVIFAISSAQNGNTNVSVDEEPGVIFLNGSCGVVGCFSTYLVGVGVHPKTVNPQSYSIVATVTLLNGSPHSVTLWDQPIGLDISNP